jgi:hypothetical protein
MLIIGIDSAPAYLRLVDVSDVIEISDVNDS